MPSCHCLIVALAAVPLIDAIDLSASLGTVQGGPKGRRKAPCS
jgi:hypothetical protein